MQPIAEPDRKNNAVFRKGVSWLESQEAGRLAQNVLFNEYEIMNPLITLFVKSEQEDLDLDDLVKRVISGFIISYSLKRMWR